MNDPVIFFKTKVKRKTTTLVVLLYAKSLRVKIKTEGQGFNKRIESNDDWVLIRKFVSDLAVAREQPKRDCRYTAKTDNKG